jgi:ABC-2 type transport system permease protein
MSESYPQSAARDPVGPSFPAAGDHSQYSIFTRVTLWFTILRISIAERLVYRVDFALGTLMRFLPMVTQIFLWEAVFAGMQASGSSKNDIAGYSVNDFIAYYLMATIGRAFSSMPGLASGIAKDIREGTVKKYLLQPIDMLGFLMLNRVAHKLVYYIVATAPFALVFYLCRGFFSGWPDAVTLLAFFTSLILGFLLGFLMDATIGMIGFWFLEVSSLMFIYMLVSFFFSGQMFPLDMLPGIWKYIFLAIPMQYFAYFPAAVFLGKITGHDLAFGLAIQFAWVIFFLVASRVAFNRGVRRYSAYGG